MNIDGIFYLLNINYCFMRIGVDIRVLTKEGQTGIEEYASLLLGEMIRQDKADEFALFFNSFSKKRADFDWMHKSNVFLKEFKLPNQFLNYSFLFNFPKIDKMIGGADIFFSPHFLPSGLSRDCKRVITFHDLSFIWHPEFFSLRKRYWHFLANIKKQAKNADKIIAISNSTKRDLIDFFGVKEEKIKVIYSGISSEFRPIDKNDPELKAIKEKYNLPENFILYLGTVEPRKNIASIIEAFELIRRNKVSPYQDLKLVIAGGLGWLYKDILKMAENSQYEDDILFISSVVSADRVYLYNLSKIFVFPSFFEGFGFPPLEAMACGVPTIASNCSSLPEVVGDGALMIDPYRPEEIAIAAREIFNDEKLKNFLIKKGVEQASEFSWEKCARETLEFIKL